MNSSSAAAKSFFLNKSFYLHIRGTSNTEKATELIKVFGGQIDHFLHVEVSYVLTDVPKTEWPPCGNHDILKRARSMNIKLMSAKDLVVWCSKYVHSQSSSDDDDDTKASTRMLRGPFIKFEDQNCQHAPTAREFNQWPEINITNLALGRSIFSEAGSLSTPTASMNNNQIPHPNNSAQLTQQAGSMRANTLIAIPPSPGTALNYQRAPTPTPSPAPPIATPLPGSPLPTTTPLANSNIVNGHSPAVTAHSNPAFTKLVPSKSVNHLVNHLNNVANNRTHAPVKRKHPIYCEICSQKIVDRIDDHIHSQLHKSNTEKMNWDEVNSVIESLPNLSTLNMRRITTLSPAANSEHQEFLCLHKVESVSQLFHSLSPMVDRKLVHIQ